MQARRLHSLQPPPNVRLDSWHARNHVRVELRRERFTAEFLDPQRGFERARLPLEIRWDPLTGQSCRLLPEGSLARPEAQDLEALAEQTGGTCPFCAERIESETPKLPPEIWPEGRIRCGEALLFPNLVAYSKWSSVSVYSPQRHLLRLDELTPALVADNLMSQVTFARAVLRHDPSSQWVSVNANQLPPSGSSIFHPHLQGSANPVPTTLQRLLAELGPARVREYLELEERDGERLIGSSGRVKWLAAFAPVGPAELRAFVPDAASPEQLDESVVAELADGLSRALRLYASLGFQSFNLALSGVPQSLLVLRLVGRAYFGALLRSDAMWSERLHLEAATDLAPERVAEEGRVLFTRASS
jgi:UDPglucose--hexose-1-phosphate uridylyltransferase